MAQIFHRSMNLLSRVSILGGVFILAALGWFIDGMVRSSYVTEVNVAREQPVPFSHKHHVAGLGLDCRYCHTTVEETNFAGIPPTKTCMNCHAQVWNDAPILEPVRASFRNDQSLEWTRVHDLADFVFFNHSIHVAKGIGCQTCHGQVDQMPLVWRTQSLYMEWCLECHREPELSVRPKEEVFSMSYAPPAKDKPVRWNGKEFTTQAELGKALVSAYNIRTPAELTSCSVCHR
jgi:hypothetical protein